MIKLSAILAVRRLRTFPSNVRTADKFAVNVQLRNSRPVAVFFNALAYGIVFQYVDSHIVGATCRIQDLYGTGRETALWELLRAFHEQYDAVGGYDFFDLIVDEDMCVPLLNRLFGENQISRHYTQIDGVEGCFSTSDLTVAVDIEFGRSQCFQTHQATGVHFWVKPISAPNPKTKPSVNRVDALT